MRVLRPALLLVALAISGPADAQYVGVVSDAAGTPLPDASVTAFYSGRSQRTTTNSRGLFSIDLGSGRYWPGIDTLVFVVQGEGLRTRAVEIPSSYLITRLAELRMQATPVREPGSWRGGPADTLTGEVLWARLPVPEAQITVFIDDEVTETVADGSGRFLVAGPPGRAHDGVIVANQAGYGAAAVRIDGGLGVQHVLRLRRLRMSEDFFYGCPSDSQAENSLCEGVFAARAGRLERAEPLLLQAFEQRRTIDRQAFALPDMALGLYRVGRLEMVDTVLAEARTARREFDHTKFCEEYSPCPSEQELFERVQLIMDYFETKGR